VKSVRLLLEGNGLPGAKQRNSTDRLGKIRIPGVQRMQRKAAAGRPAKCRGIERRAGLRSRVADVLRCVNLDVFVFFRRVAMGLRRSLGKYGEGPRSIEFAQTSNLRSVQPHTYRPVLRGRKSGYAPVEMKNW
jgi:hypothetical protein